MGLLPSAEGKWLLKQTHADKDSESVSKFPLLFCRLCAVMTETTAAPAVTAASLTAPPARGALTLFPGSPNWAPWPSRTPPTTSNVTTRAAALQERPAANCRQESGAAARWSRSVHHWLHFVSCTILQGSYAPTTSVTHLTIMSDVNVKYKKTSFAFCLWISTLMFSPFLESVQRADWLQTLLTVEMLQLWTSWRHKNECSDSMNRSD